MRRNELMVYAAAIFVMQLVALPLPVKAAELTGFGPIKFGMTKEQAWAAIDGKGKWEREGNWLRYEPALHDRIGKVIQLTDLKFEVIQTFDDNLASDVTVEITASTVYPPSCTTELNCFVSAIQHKYGKPTLVVDNVFDTARNKKGLRSEATSFRIFAFDDEALIRVVLGTWEGEPSIWSCILEVWYHPPYRSPFHSSSSKCGWRGQDGGHWTAFLVGAKHGRSRSPHCGR